MQQNSVDASQLSQRTLTFLLTDTRILLGYKKTGFGQGNYLGIGGKLEAGETIEEAAAREVQEEVSVKVGTLQKVAELTFLFPDKSSWSQHVHVFLCYDWKEKPRESTEIRPEWFAKDNIPFAKMWDDNKYWLPALLGNHTLNGVFTFDQNLKVAEASLKERSQA